MNNTIIKNKKSMSVSLIISLSMFVSSMAGAQVTDSTKMPGYEIKTFQSKILGEKRKIRIQTPTDVNPYDSYPVLYVLDGESQTTMVGGQVQYLSESYKIIPNLIVVGIDNTDRMRDLTPTKDTTIGPPGKTTGGGEKFLQFIKQELMPYIESHYKTVPFKILAGHSLGGLMAVYCLTNHPDYFDGYIAISPSMQWDNNNLLLQIGKNNVDISRNKFFFFSDANEDVAFHNNELKLDTLLQQKNITALKTKRMFYPEETHISEPVKAFYDGIRFIYPNWHLPYSSSAFRKTMTSIVIKDQFAKLSAKYQYNVIPSHDDMIAIGKFLRNDPKRINDAVELLEMNTANYPTSPIAWETLGDTYIVAGDMKAGKNALQKALLLNPENEKLREKIKRIQQ